MAGFRNETYDEENLEGMLKYKPEILRLNNNAPYYGIKNYVPKKFFEIDEMESDLRKLARKKEKPGTNKKETQETQENDTEPNVLEMGLQEYRSNQMRTKELSDDLAS